MRRYATQAEINCIPNVNYKRNHICSMYTQHCDYTDPQGYLMEQLELNPKLLAKNHRVGSGDHLIIKRQKSQQKKISMISSKGLT